MTTPNETPVVAKGEVAAAPPPKQPPLDFAKVEALRKHMLLNVGQMATVLKVSRITYNAWVKGGPIRRSNDKTVREKLRTLLAVMTKEQWPTPHVIAMTGPQRLETLLEVMEKYE